jgi:hypothetical protein
MCVDWCVCVCCVCACPCVLDIAVCVSVCVYVCVYFVRQHKTSDIRTLVEEDHKKHELLSQ